MIHSPRFILHPLTFILLLVLLPACSNFEQRWNSPPLPPDPIAGRYAGTWKSDAGHHGTLRAIFVHSAPYLADSHVYPYTATFKASFFSLFTAEYAVDFTFTTTGDHLTFTGSKDLGPLAGGLYHYTGELHQSHFTAHYSSPEDQGTFTLTHLP